MAAMVKLHRGDGQPGERQEWAETAPSRSWNRKCAQGRAASNIVSLKRISKPAKQAAPIRRRSHRRLDRDHIHLDRQLGRALERIRGRSPNRQHNLHRWLSERMRPHNSNDTPELPMAARLRYRLAKLSGQVS